MTVAAFLLAVVSLIASLGLGLAIIAVFRRIEEFDSQIQSVASHSLASSADHFDDAQADVAPRIRARGPNGATVDTDLLTGSGYVVVFVDPACGPCVDLVPKLREAAAKPGALPWTLMIVQGPEIPAEWSDTSVSTEHMVLLADPSSAIRESFHVRASPYGVWIDPNGRIRARSIVTTTDAVCALVRRGNGRHEAELRNGPRSALTREVHA
jgi:hypothetical protein